MTISYRLRTRDRDGPRSPPWRSRVEIARVGGLIGGATTVTRALALCAVPAHRDARHPPPVPREADQRADQTRRQHAPTPIPSRLGCEHAPERRAVPRRDEQEPGQPSQPTGDAAGRARRSRHLRRPLQSHQGSPIFVRACVASQPSAGPTRSWVATPDLLVGEAGILTCRSRIASSASGALPRTSLL